MNTVVSHARALLRPGHSLGTLECGLAYLLPLGYALLDAPALKPLMMWNACCQFFIFITVVQIPLAITGKMAYVDIGWPCGLVALGCNGLWWGRGWGVRRFISCGCMILHGARMFIGALVMFYPYTFKDGDLSRYQFAKHRWVVEEKLYTALWPLKAQFDTLTQCFANCIILACPILLAASNTTQTFHILEIVGVLLWILSWVLENIADGQKILFLKDCKSLAKQQSTPERKEKIKLSVLGYHPFDTGKYWLWTWCRHPNYFFEWMSWVSFAMIGFGSIVTMNGWIGGDDVAPLTVLCSATLVLTLRFFYDCLVYWTGAAPAEQQSVRKRPMYQKYQETTQVLFPFWVPSRLVDHHCIPGWPLLSPESSTTSASSTTTKKVI